MYNGAAGRVLRNPEWPEGLASEIDEGALGTGINMRCRGEEMLNFRPHWDQQAKPTFSESQQAGAQQCTGDPSLHLVYAIRLGSSNAQETKAYIWCVPSGWGLAVHRRHKPAFGVWCQAGAQQCTGDDE